MVTDGESAFVVEDRRNRFLATLGMTVEDSHPYCACYHFSSAGVGILTSVVLLSGYVVHGIGRSRRRRI